MKYLGVDFGLKRVGLATSEGTLASPLKTIAVSGFTDALKKLIEFCKKEEFTKVIVGMPEGKMGKNVLGFVKKLKKEGIDVETVDETLSSHTARQTMIGLGVSKKKRRHEDAYSAAEILQNYLEFR